MERYIQTRRFERDENGNVVGARDANDHDVRFEYDGDGLLLVAERKQMNDPRLRTRSYELRMEVSHDPVLERVRRSTAWMRVEQGLPNGDERETHYLHDEYGRLVGVALPGDSLERPTTEYRYSVSDPVTQVTTTTRSEADSTIADLTTIECTDGMGRTFQNRVQIRPGEYQVSGYIVFNNQGEAARVFQSYRSNSSACDRSPPEGVLYVDAQFDSTGRVLRVRQPDDPEYGTQSEMTTSYLPLRVVSSDAERQRFA